jgi:glycosyltransferase involved in cell wall biosynthesis
MSGRILVIDPDVEGDEHVPFNAGVLSAVLAAAPDREVAFHAGPRHRAAVLDALPAATAKLLAGGPIGAAGHGSRDRVLDRGLWALLRARPLAAGDRLIVLTATRATLLTLGGLTALGMVARGQAFVICHSILARLWLPRRRNPILRQVDFEAALRATLRGGHRLVLVEPGIRAAFAERCPDLASSTRLWPHPLPERRAPPPSGRAGGSPRLGFLGWASDDKGFGHFVAAARMFSACAEFHVVGHRKPEDAALQLHDVSALATAPRDSFWPRAEYDRQVATLDYVCLFHDPGHYRAVASGVLMDALAFSVPVIAPDMPLVSAIAAEHGEIGFLYAGTAGRDAAIRAALAARGTPRHAAMRDALARAAASRRPEALATRIAADLAGFDLRGAA